MNRYKIHLPPKFKVGDTIYINEEGQAWNGQNVVRHGFQLHILRQAHIYIIGDRMTGNHRGWEYFHEHSCYISTSKFEEKQRTMAIPISILERFYEHEPIQSIQVKEPLQVV